MPDFLDYHSSSMFGLLVFVVSVALNFALAAVATSGFTNLAGFLVLIFIASPRSSDGDVPGFAIPALFVFHNPLLLVFYFSQAWGLRNMALALKVQNPWFAWVPGLQIHTLLKVAGKTWGGFLVWMGVIFSFFILPSFFIARHNDWDGLLIIMASWFCAGASCLSYGSRITDGIAKRLGQGLGASLALLFFPFLSYPAFGLIARMRPVSKDR